MGKKKTMKRLERENLYWRGVKSCALWIGGALLGTAAFSYYVIEIIKFFKL